MFFKVFKQSLISFLSLTSRAHSFEEVNYQQNISQVLGFKYAIVANYTCNKIYRISLIRNKYV